MRFFRISSVLLIMLYTFNNSANADVASIESTLIGTPGSSVSVSGEWAAVGAYDPSIANSCYVTMYKFNYDPAIWAWQEYSTVPSNTTQCNGNKGFGVAVSLSGTRLAVGLAEFGNGQDTNGAYSTYEFDGTNWAEHNTQIEAPDKQNLSGFGETLSIRGNYVIVGAPRDDTSAGTDSGKVYIYDWNPTTSGNGGNQVYDTLEEIDGLAAGENFGQAVTGQDLQLLVGAPGYDVVTGSNTNEGAAYLYDFNGVTATPIETLIGTDANDTIGSQVAMDSNNIIVSGHTPHVFVKENDVWNSGIKLPWVHNGDVSISAGVFSIGDLGSSVYNYLDLKKDLSVLNYNVDIHPTTTNTSETAEDISLDRDQLLVKHSITQPAYAYDFPCGYGIQLVENTWSLVGVPCAIPAGTTVGEAFNTNPSFGSHDNLGVYGDDANWVVYEQNSTYGTTDESYRLMAENDVVENGKGYWIICDHNVTTRVDATISSARTTLDTTYSGVDIGATTLQTLPDGNASGDGNTTILLTNDLSRRIHWGNVQLGATGLTNVRMDDNASKAVFDQATAYVYDETGSSQPYRAITTTPGFDDVIEPGQGYWVKILGSATGVEIRLPYEK